MHSRVSGWPLGVYHYNPSLGPPPHSRTLIVKIYAEASIAGILTPLIYQDIDFPEHTT